MVTSIVSSSSFSSAAYILKNNAKSSTEAVAQVASASKSSTGQNPLQTDSLSIRSKNSSAINSNIISNVGNALSFLNAQAASLNRVATMVSQLSEITSKMNDVTMTKADKAGYTQQISGLRSQLGTEINSTYGDQSLHSLIQPSGAYAVSLATNNTQSVSFTQSDFFSSSGGLGWLALTGTAASSLTEIPSDTNDTNSSGGSIISDGTGENSDGGNPTGGASFGVSEGDNAGNTSQQTNQTQNSNSGSNNGLVKNAAQSSSDVGTSTDPLSITSWSASDFESLTNAVSAMLANNSAQQESLQNGLDMLKARDTGFATATSQITDSDVAHQLASLAKFQLVNQSASSAMTQTNLSAQSVIKALWGEPSSGIEWYKPEQLTSILPKIAFA